MTTATVSSPLTWIAVQTACRDCGKRGPTVEKQPDATVRITFACTGRQCRGVYEQRHTV